MARWRDWRSVDPLDLVMSAQNAELARKGPTRQGVPMSVDADSPIRDMVTAWNRTSDA